MNKEDIKKDLLRISDENPYYKYNHIEFVDILEDGVCLKVNLRNEMLNPYGIAHGGLVYTLMDCTAGLSARIDGRRYVTQAGSVNYLLPANSKSLVGIGKIIKRGNAISLIEVNVYSEDKAHHLAHGIFTMYCIGNITFKN